MGVAHVKGLDEVGTYPALFAELARGGWSDAHLAKLAWVHPSAGDEQDRTGRASLRSNPPIKQPDASPAPRS